MSEALKQLTEQLYNEGVSKAKTDAQSILSDADKKSKKTIKEAEDKAKEIIEKAEKEASDLKRRTENEIKQSFAQVLKSVEKEITDMIVLDFSKDAVKKNFDQAEFVKEIILAAMHKWDDKNKDIQVEIAGVIEKHIDKNFIASLQDKANKSVEIKVDPEIKAGFRLGPADGSYKITFREEDFQELIKKYLRPQVRKILFG